MGEWVSGRMDGVGEWMGSVKLNVIYENLQQGLG